MINQAEINIWGRDFTLPIEYDCYGDENVTKAQEDAIERFLSHPEWSAYAKKEVEDYCRAQVMEDNCNKKKNNIFSYLKPDCIFVKREKSEKDRPRVALMCKYRYDPEHGLAIVFASDGEVIIGSQDIIL